MKRIKKINAINYDPTIAEMQLNNKKCELEDRIKRMIEHFADNIHSGDDEDEVNKLHILLALCLCSRELIDVMPDIDIALSFVGHVISFNDMVLCYFYMPRAQYTTICETPNKSLFERIERRRLHRHDCRIARGKFNYQERRSLKLEVNKMKKEYDIDLSELVELIEAYSNSFKKNAKKKKQFEEVLSSSEYCIRANEMIQARVAQLSGGAGGSTAGE